MTEDQDLSKAWKKILGNFEEEQNGSFLFDDWYVTEENQTRYLRQYQDDAVFRKIVQINCNEKFEKYLYQRAIDVNNMVNCFSGQAGTGKSQLSRAILKKMIRIRKTIMNEESNYTFIFNPAKLKSEFKKMKYGDMVQLDEWVKPKGDNSKLFIDELENLLATMRMTRKCIHLCTPMDVRLLGTTSVFEPFGYYKQFKVKERAIQLSRFQDFDETNKYLKFEFNTKISHKNYEKIKLIRKSFMVSNPNADPNEIEEMIKKKILDYNDMKTRALWYTTDPRTKKETLQGIIIVDIGKELQEDDGYEKAKADNYKELEAHGGSVSAESDFEYELIRDLALEVYQFAKNRFSYPKNPENPAKADLSMYLREYQREKGIEPYALGTKERNVFESLVVQFASDDYNQKKKSNAPQQTSTTTQTQDTSGEFKFDLDKLLEEIKNESKSPIIDRNIEIYRKLQNPMNTFETIIKEYPALKTRQSVEYAIKKVKGSINQKLGDQFEPYVMPYLQRIFSNVQKIGGVGRPDYICIDKKSRTFFISVKCLDFATNYELLYSEHNAEIKEAREYYQATGIFPFVIAYVYNRYNKQYYTRTIPEVIIKANYPLNEKMKDILRLDEFDKSNVLESMINS